MAKRQYKFHNGARGAALAIRVTPRARRDGITGIMQDGTIKIRLTAPPVEGKANKALIEFLSRIFSIPASHFEIVAGETSRDKLVSIIGVEAQRAQEILIQHLEKKKSEK